MWFKRGEIVHRGWMLLAGLLLLAGACAERPPITVIGREQALEEVSLEEVPLERDDLSRSSLEEAIYQSLRYYERLPEDTRFRFGKQSVSLGRMKRSLETFRRLLADCESWHELADEVRKHFIAYRSVGADSDHGVLFTGYYEPTIQGSLQPDEHYRFPLYGVPDDLKLIDLGDFRSEYQGIRLIGRCEADQVVPYYTREEIDCEKTLSGRGQELVWLADPVARFFLQIQGSGRIRLLNGDYIRITYAASNGRPYRSIGRLLIEQGHLPREAVSMQAIRRYLREHPEKRDEILNQNPSYVFFREVEDGPLGSLSVPVTAGRSIATDPSFFPRGALAFIECRKPVFARDGVIMGWTDFARYALNQDTGGAIRGPARVDLFWGNGPFSRIAAGHMKHYGHLYFLLVKDR